MASSAAEAESVASLFLSRAAPADARLSGLFSSENKAKFARLVKQPELQAPKVKKVKIAVPQAETVVGSEGVAAAGKKRKLPGNTDALQAPAAAAAAATSGDEASAKRAKKPKWKKRSAEEAKAQAASEQSAENATPGEEAAQGGDAAAAATAENEAAAAEDAEERTLFVGNVSLNTKLKALRALFAQFGEIASMRMRSVPTEGVAVDQPGNQALVRKVSVNKHLFGDQKGSYNAYIVYKNAESVTAALCMNNHVLDGRHLRVDRSNPSQFPPKRTVFLGQLPHIIDEEQLREHFAAVLPNGQDDIESVRLIRDRETLEGKGIGYLWLKDEACVVQALTLDGSTFGKRTIRVTTCGKRTKRTAMTPEEKREQEQAFRAQQHMGALSGAAKRIRAKALKKGKKPGKPAKAGKGKIKGKAKGKGKAHK